MLQGQFCFLEEAYYKKFPDDKLMRNKEVIGGISHNRPCFFAFPDKENPNILWLVPVSSKYEKYRAIYDKKVEKYGRCNTIVFGKLLNNEAAFLIQNICPVTHKYIREVYVDKNNNPVQIDNRTVREVVKNAQEVIAKVNRGAVIVFPNIKTIYRELAAELKQEKTLQDINAHASIRERIAATKFRQGQRELPKLKPEKEADRENKRHFSK